MDIRKTRQENLEEWKHIVCSLKFPQNITNKWIDELKKTDDYDDFWRWGFCYRDMSEYDLHKLDKKHLQLITFNSSTIWPSADKMPKDFDPNAILENGRDPMLGIRELHHHGIDGSGVTIAVIDEGCLNHTHAEFENANIEADNSLIEHIHFHGEDVVANLCGKTIGVAPKAKVLYYGFRSGPNCSEQMLLNLQKILQRIKDGENIKIVNRSGPFYKIKNMPGRPPVTPDEIKIAQNIDKVVAELNSRGCQVVDSHEFGKYFSCADYAYNEDNKDINNLHKPDWWGNTEDTEKVNVVCAGKVVPEFLSDTGYKYEQLGCYSWSIPQAVGLYALCLQVNPNATWEQFVEVAKQTSVVNKNKVRVASPKELVKTFAKQNGKMASYDSEHI